MSTVNRVNAANRVKHFLWRFLLWVGLIFKPLVVYGLESIAWDQSSSFQGSVSLMNRSVERGVLLTEDEPAARLVFTYMHPKGVYLGGLGQWVMGGGIREAEYQYYFGKAFVANRLNFNLDYRFTDIHHNISNHWQEVVLRSGWKNWHYTRQAGLHGELESYQLLGYRWHLPKNILFLPSYAKGQYDEAGFLDDHHIIRFSVAYPLSPELEIKMSYSTTGGLVSERRYWMMELRWQWSKKMPQVAANLFL